MFDPEKYRKTPFHWWPQHDRTFVHPLVGGLGLLALVVSFVYGFVGDAMAIAAFVVLALLVLPVLLGLGKVVQAAVSAFR